MFKDVIKKKRLDYESVHFVLEKLSNENIYMLMSDYYDGMRLQEISDKYKLELKVTNIVPYFPRYLTDVECPYCEGYMTAAFLSRTNKEILRIKHCNLCGHSLDRNCRCETCKEIEDRQKRALMTKKNDIFRKMVIAESAKEMIKENDLDMRQRLYLATLLHCGLSEDAKIIMSLEEIIDVIAPSDDFKINMIKYLYNTNIIAISEQSPLDAFIYDLDNEIITSYYVEKVMYRINIKPNDDNYGQMVKRLLYPDASLFNDEFCYDLWREINLAEAIQYFKYHMDKVRFTTEIGEKTRRNFERIVDHFSLSEIFYIISRSIANGTKLYQSGEYSKAHAINIVKTDIANYSERVLANKWNLTGYNRDYNLPECMLSKILFNNIMKIDYLGFRNPPTNEL